MLQMKEKERKENYLFRVIAEVTDKNGEIIEINHFVNRYTRAHEIFMELITNNLQNTISIVLIDNSVTGEVFEEYRSYN